MSQKSRPSIVAQRSFPRSTAIDMGRIYPLVISSTTWITPVNLGGRTINFPPLLIVFVLSLLIATLLIVTLLIVTSSMGKNRTTLGGSYPPLLVRSTY